MFSFPDFVLDLIDDGASFSIHWFVDRDPDVPFIVKVLSCEYTSQESSSGAIIGNAFSASLELKVQKFDDWDAAPLVGCHASVTLYIQGGGDYSLIHGTITKSIDEGDTLHIRIDDALAINGNKIYVPSESVLESCRISDIAHDVAHQLGLGGAPGFSQMLVPIGAYALLKNTTLRNAAAQCAAISGGNAFVGRNGMLSVSSKIDPAGGVAKTVTPYLENCQLSGAPIQFKSVELFVQKTAETDLGDGETISTIYKESYSVGDESPTIRVNNQFANQSVADEIFAGISSKQFYSGSFECPREIALEPGDYITVRTPEGDKNIFVSAVSLTIDGGCRTRIEATAVDAFDFESEDIRESVDNAELLGLTAQEALTTIADNLREFKENTDARINGKSNALLVKSFTTASQNIGANTSTALDINVAQSGYTPIGCVGTVASNAYCWLQTAYVSGNTCRIRIRNIASAARDTTGTVYILYSKN